MATHTVLAAAFAGALALAAAVAAPLSSAVDRNATRDAARDNQDGSDVLVVRGKYIYTMAGAPITDGVVVMRGGKIVAVGKAAEVVVPAGARILAAELVVPGLVDAHTCVGLAGWLNIDHDKDEIDRSEATQPELSAVDAYNAQEPLVDWVRGFGVTTIHTGHAPLSLIPGQTMVAKTRGNTVEDAVIVRECMVAACLGDDGRGDGGPGTRAKSMAVLRKALLEGREHADAQAKAAADDEKDPPSRDLRKEALARIVRGDTPLLVTAHRAQDIMNVLRLRAEFADVRFVLDGAAEAHLVLEQLAEAGLPVIVHPTMYRAGGETRALSMETPKLLAEAGLLVGMQSGYEGYVPRTRVVLFEAAMAARYGVPFERALAMITIDAARILGVDDRVGSIAVGKDGDLALFDGDPFEYTTHCIGTVIDGRLESDGERPNER